ncbi:hypothetical protein F7725_007782 [Dissostichus mawsoni]|uniref:Uncharacterized protein n=1 Tax=Dissostichus mawsoni TaxID=36200 RepID=A0A7J5Y7C2_DISMA|nr:hypothetical protein F7725_007782 [Dissostichus mawsoni]
MSWCVEIDLLSQVGQDGSDGSVGPICTSEKTLDSAIPTSAAHRPRMLADWGPGDGGTVREEECRTNTRLTRGWGPPSSSAWRCTSRSVCPAWSAGCPSPTQAEHAPSAGAQAAGPQLPQSLQLDGQAMAVPPWDVVDLTPPQHLKTVSDIFQDLDTNKTRVSLNGSLYLLNLELSVQQLLSGQFHWEVSPGKEHCVSVQSLGRACLCGLRAALPRTDSLTAAGAEGESPVQEAASPDLNRFASQPTLTLHSKMNKMCLAFLGALLLALHLISTQVVQALNSTDNTPMNYTTMVPTNIGVNTTLKGGCGWTAASTLLLPLAVAASLLFGRS